MFDVPRKRNLHGLASDSVEENECSISKHTHMNALDDQKRSERPFDWNEFRSCVIEAYGGFDSPSYAFTHFSCEISKYPEVVDLLKEHYRATEDTEPNTDVSYGYVVTDTSGAFVLRVSFVGPYFYISPILLDGTLAAPNKNPVLGGHADVLYKQMENLGFIFTPGDVLRTTVDFGEGPTSVYAILYSYEDQPAWLTSFS